MKPGWVSASIKELFDINYGKGLPKEYRKSSGLVSVYGSNGVVGKHDKSLTAGTTIVIGRKGSVGEVHLSSESCWPIDTTYFIDDFPCSLPPKYWMLYLKSLQLGQHDKSSAIPGISRNDIYAIEVPLPPLNEQRRIVAKLERLLTKVDACKERLGKIPTILKRFRQSVLASACSGRLTADWREKNPDVEPAEELLRRIEEERKKEYEKECAKAKSEGKTKPKRPIYFDYSIQEHVKPLNGIFKTWVNSPVGFLCDCIVPGRDKPKSFTGSIPWVTLPDITTDEIDKSLSRLNLSESEVKEVNARIIPPQAVIMSCIGRFGISALVKRPIVINQQLHAFLPSNVILPKYLMYHIRTLVEYMNSIATSTTISYLNKTNCNSLPINLPPLLEQQEIVRRVEALFKVADQIEERYKKAKAYVDKLTQSILAKAFRGELVLQDPNDEPASVLLERIREERDKKQDKSESRKTKTRRRQRRQNQLEMDI